MDPLDKAGEVAASLSFPVAWGVERELGDELGSFWEERRNFIQPTEFILRKDGQIISSTYSSSPVGRTDSAEALTLLGFLSARAKRQ